jgi:hypothetical protein
LCLELDDFKSFSETSKGYWTTPGRLKDFKPGTSYEFVDSYNILRIKLQQYYDVRSMKTQFSISKFAESLHDKSIDIYESAESARYEWGIEQREAKVKLQASIDGVLNEMEYFCRKMFDFLNSVLKIIGLASDKSIKEASWGYIERLLHFASDTLLENLDKSAFGGEEMSHITDRIRSISLLCWGCSEKLAKDGDRIPGNLGVAMREFRDMRNNIRHAAASLDQNLDFPRTLFEECENIRHKIETILSVIKDNDCFPDSVRIMSIGRSVNGTNITAASVFTKRNYHITYTDEIMIGLTAQEVMESIVYEEKDQDFWLFPASGVRSLFNPLLIPQGNIDHYRLMDVFLTASLPPEPLTDIEAIESIVEESL